MSPLAAAILIAALGTALIGGLFFAFSAFIMAALAARPAAEGMAAMVSINRVILRSLFMPVFFGAALLCLGIGIYALLDGVARFALADRGRGGLPARQHRGDDGLERAAQQPHRPRRSGRGQRGALGVIIARAGRAGTMSARSPR